ncbi:hypothetical protein SCLCIDRAFT_1217243 [Scleroderma citrinum Foug A]|uniref:Uncharacterized protein n=1 Tax=Scleroderma citrinum Foug A TaxID=1036808 RepID=A0A0C2ZDZ0_9AGAM|nr:hypothetical protein SCLCIDRAFT_1217243 [Scleroderma citrinum Foug A]
MHPSQLAPAPVTPTFSICPCIDHHCHHVALRREWDKIVSIQCPPRRGSSEDEDRRHLKTEAICTSTEIWLPVVGVRSELVP